MVRIAVALLLLSVTTANCSSYAPTPVARTKNGSYVGVHSEVYGQDYFLGIPYAQAPIGDLRFRVPASLNQSWKGTRDATKYSAECYGYGSDQWNYPISEDCLYLNVVRPTGYDEQTLPVAFWIHGGGFTQGGSVDQRYNLSFAVQRSVKIGQPVIGVSINYRLSAFGFLSGSEELSESANLNVGLKDQRLALQWVQENIGAFGGNPKQVTIWGESAGGASVGFHLTAYNGRDDKLFRAAIMESGNPVFYSSLYQPSVFLNNYNLLTARTGCTNATSPLNCLRKLPIAQLNTALNITSTTLNLTSWQPVIDGDFIRGYTSLQLASGAFVHVPIISGANSDEGTSFSPYPVNTETDIYNYIIASPRLPVPPSLATQILQAYPDDPSQNVIANLGTARPGPTYGAQYRRAASYAGDVVFIANRRLTCQTWAAAGVDAYCYRFNAIPAGIPPEIGVTHFQEVAFVFYNLDGVGYLPAAVPPFLGKPETYSRLSRFMSSSWVSFVHSLDPNAWRKKGRWNGTEELWPRYRLDRPQNMVFDANVTSYAEADTYRKEGIDLINAHNADVYLR